MTRCRTTRALITTRRERSLRREAEKLAARPRPKLPACALRVGCTRPPAFSAAARAWAMNGRDRLPRERMRPSRMRRSSSRVITSVARGMLLPVLTMTCKIRQAVVRKATSCQVFNHLPLSTRPTAAHLAAFILPSLGRLASATLLLGHWCDILRIAAMGVHASHCGLRRDDVGTNKRSIGELAVDGCAFETRDDGDCSAAGRSFGALFDSVADSCGFDGNNALDQPRSRSSNAEPDAKGESFDGGSVSDPMSSNSMLASFGISTLGASPFATVVATASANLTSGRCQEPR